MENKYTDLLQSNEYWNELSKMAELIIQNSLRAPNEATIESRFECELFAFFRTYFSRYGFEYNPIKEASLHTQRHVSKGRADTAISSLIIEFKHPSTLSNQRHKKKALNQITNYMVSLSEDENEIEGFITDGVIGCFITIKEGNIKQENFYNLNAEALDRVIRNILELKLVAFNARNLVESFCNPPINDGVAYDFVKVLFGVLNNRIQPKTQMLFNEWKELFNLSHNDVSKQTAIIIRKASLENLLKCKFKNNNDEYIALFALQTVYAIIVKLIAFKVVSQARYNESLIDFHSALNMSAQELRIQMSNLEDGDIFIQYGINNLLEGDFFSWYSDETQWSTEIAGSIQKILEVLSRYSDRGVINNATKTHDFFKELYETMIPIAVRHSLGEYYTKKWLAQNVIEESLSLIKNKENWTGVDPCCGSGTFLTIMIDKVLYSNRGLSQVELLTDVVKRVKGIDLNPLSVLTARVNYFINIAHLLDDNYQLEIPVYLGDASYVPKKTTIDGVDCLEYTINTLKNPIEILVPQSMVQNPLLFSQKMNLIEKYIKIKDIDLVYDTLCSLVDDNELTAYIKERIRNLAEQLVDLEKRKWNGIWARIVTNFLTTSNLGQFDLVVGNPPWVDWKSLPSGYRDRIKQLCISRKLFSGDVITGGINLNICALIANVSSQNWLAETGALGFLMPEPLVFQQSYEGFRNLYIDDDTRLYFCKFTNWTKSGNPFYPVTQKFLSYYAMREKRDYKKGIKTTWYIKKKGAVINKEEIDIKKCFTTKVNYLATCNANKNFFSYVNSEEEAELFRKIGAKDNYYVGREGIEFYPQELMLFELSGIPSTNTCTALRNYQNNRSKYNVPSMNILLETEFLHPLVKGKEIKAFHINNYDFIVPFPYDSNNPKVPITINDLMRRAPNLANYYQKHKSLIMEQTEYNEKIIGKPEAEFYALARVGEYSYAKHYVAFRDNTKWVASVVSEINTSWGGRKRPVFQNHAVSICQDITGTFITLDEAHYICGILNAPCVEAYIMSSGDTRTLPIRPPITLPKYDKSNPRHAKISKLSIKGHDNYDKPEVIDNIRKEINNLYIEILNECCV